MTLSTRMICLLAALVLAPATHSHETTQKPDNGPKPDSHAPMGVMGDHLHDAGEWMVSYRYMAMAMEGNRKGTRSRSPESIVSREPNRFADTPMQPDTLRVVPTRMRMDMHMLGLMAAPTDTVTLMAMVGYAENRMDHLTFAGGSGTDRLGRFTTRSDGFGDTRLSALIRLHDTGVHRWHANLGLSLPTGSITESDRILTPMGERPHVRLPYGMQLGSGTTDLEPGLTYAGNLACLSWGAQYRATLRTTGHNSEGYHLGNEHRLTGWMAYRLRPWMSGSVRVNGWTREPISGRDARIIAPVQTADPDNYGGDFVDLALGVNLVGRHGVLTGQRLGMEVSLPAYRDYNGLQMDDQWQATLAWQYAW